MKLTALVLMLMLVFCISTGFGKDTPDLTKNLGPPVTLVAKGENVSIIFITSVAKEATKNQEQGILVKNIETGFIDTGQKTNHRYIYKDTQISPVTLANCPEPDNPYKPEQNPSTQIRDWIN